MNYRHAFHAGNHGDVLKHIVVSRILDYLMRKERPFAVLDAHAGTGRYDLRGPEAFKTGEWEGGIARILSDGIPDAIAELMAPYMQVINALNPDGVLGAYPGSPELAARLLRPTDRMIFNELHPVDAELLAARYASDRRVRVTHVDALQAIKAELPFRERRGLVLIDPAFEAMDETAKVAQMVRHGIQRMANAIFVIWYPVTTEEFARAFQSAVAAAAPEGGLCAELRVREVFAQGGLAGSGVIIINPSFTLAEELKALMPFLAQRLGVGNWGRSEVGSLKPPR